MTRILKLHDAITRVGYQVAALVVILIAGAYAFEVVARYFFREVKARLGAEGGLLRRVRVWEAPGCSASFQE